MSPRAASLSDAPTIARLDAACFPAAPWAPAQVRAELSRAGATALVDDDVGYALGWALAGEGELVRIGVAPRARRGGTGGRLLAAFLAAQEAAGAQTTWLEVRADNGAAIGLYAAAGFTRRGSRARYYADGCDAVVMGHDAAAGAS